MMSESSSRRFIRGPRPSIRQIVAYVHSRANEPTRMHRAHATPEVWSIFRPARSHTAKFRLPKNMGLPASSFRMHDVA